MLKNQILTLEQGIVINDTRQLKHIAQLNLINHINEKFIYYKTPTVNIYKFTCRQLIKIIFNMYICSYEVKETLHSVLSQKNKQS